MANSNNWGEIYKSTWWGDKAWSANTLFIDSAPPGFGLNLLKASEDMDNTLDWTTRTGASVSAQNTNDPNGELTAERVDFAADKNSRIQQLVTLEASTTYTFSVHAKVPSGSQDFRLKALGVPGAGSFTALSSDWTRFDFDFTTTTAGTYTLAIMNATDGAARSIQLWGAMLNEGVDVGGYVKTDASFGGSSPTPEYSGFGDEFVGVTAYYSLRQFTEAETLNAIRVRRSSDDTEQDIGFDANGDLDTTALTTFVNEDVNQYTSDFSSTEDLNESNGTGAAAQSVGGVDDAYKLTCDSTISFHSATTPSIFEVGQVYNVSFKYYIPSGQTIDGIRFIDWGISNQSTLDEWVSVNETNLTSTRSNIRFFAADGTSITPSTNVDGDVFYLKDLIITQTTADGAVTTFYDQTGNGNDATNATASEQPLVVSGGTLVTENGKAAIDFDGVDDYFTGGAKTTMNDTAIFAVIKSDSNTQDSVFIQNTLDASNLVALGLGAGGALSRLGSQLRVGGSDVVAVGDNTFTATDQTLVSYLADTTSAEIHIDGVQETNITLSRKGGSNTTIGARGDANYPFNGAMQEVIFFDSDQSANLGTITTGGGTLIQGNINTYFDIV